MARRYLKPKPVTLVQQQIKINQLFYHIVEKLYIENSQLVCIMSLQPSAEAETYTVKITYKLSDIAPKAWLLSPEMQAYKGENPHHVYGKDENGHYQLCVYHPRSREWSQQMYLAETFIPWICSWLNTYEYWLITGEWYYDEKFVKSDKKKKWMRQ